MAALVEGLKVVCHLLFYLCGVRDSTAIFFRCRGPEGGESVSATRCITELGGGCPPPCWRTALPASPYVTKAASLPLTLATVGQSPATSIICSDDLRKKANSLRLWAAVFEKEMQKDLKAGLAVSSHHLAGHASVGLVAKRLFHMAEKASWKSGSCKMVMFSFQYDVSVFGLF